MFRKFLHYIFVHQRVWEIVEQEFENTEANAKSDNNDEEEEEEGANVISFEECEAKIKIIKREYNKYLKSLSNEKLDQKGQKALDKLKTEFQMRTENLKLE